MNRQETRDAFGGALIMLFGAGMVIWAYQTLPMGSPRRMGPGMFPAGVGVLIALTGLGILGQSLWQRARQVAVDTKPDTNLRALIFISAALLAFGLMVGPFGMIPAIIALVCLCALSDRDGSLAATLVLCLTLPVAVYLIFKLGLGLPMAMIRWPF
ncbi:tripartite tricarboxylate transporter TctB family protein [Cereibacter sphaeroides]|nr:tripartite tricarboxylate transporter TctB family protein [Cereibacter sphaeroides]